MLTKDVLIQRAKREKLTVTTKTPIQTIAEGIAKQVAGKLGAPMPRCFGRLHDLTALDSMCRECKIEPYCEIVFVRVPKSDYHIIAENDVQESAPFGFKDGSRAAILIKAWKSNLVTKGELRRLSNKLFSSTIDIQRILTELQKRRMLIHDGKYYGIRRPTT